MFASKIMAARDTVPQNAVFVWASSGRQPERTMKHDDEIRRPVIMVHVRHSRQKDGSDLAQLIFNSLLGTVPTGYLDMYSANSSPVDGGFDSDGRHHFSIAYVAAYLGT